MQISDAVDVSRESSYPAKPDGLAAHLRRVDEGCGHEAGAALVAFAPVAPTARLGTTIVMLRYQRMPGSSPALEDELLAARSLGENCVQPPGDAKEWLEDKWRELKKLARV